MSTKPTTQLPASPPLPSSDLLAEIEITLVTINTAEGYLLVGNVAHGMRMLAKGKSILERIVSANTQDAQGGSQPQNIENIRMKPETQSGGSARSGCEILLSLRLHGWKEDIMGMVMKSGDGKLIQVIWPDGQRIEAPAPNAPAQRPPAKNV